MSDDQRTVRKIQLPRSEGYSSTAVSPFAHELNEQQLAAVTAPHGPVLVLAGAGSGKTRVITYRVAQLVMQGVRPWQIMLTTFTNKAAREMLHRVENLIGPQAREVASGTFHHLANLILRRHGKVLGYDSNFTILDEADARSVMKLCRSEAGVDKGDKVFPSERVLVDLASAVINTNTALDTLILRRFPHLYDQYDGISQVIAAYHVRKRGSNQMDYDDLLVNWHRLLAEHPEVRDSLAGRYRHVLVDEYQDVNHIQAEIVRRLYEGIGKSEEQTAVPDLPIYDLDTVPPPLQEDLGARAIDTTVQQDQDVTQEGSSGAGPRARHSSSSAEDWLGIASAQVEDFHVYRRRLPHWRLSGAMYFVTWRLAKDSQPLSHAERQLVGDALRFFDGERYFLYAYVVMDDHVHVLVQPNLGYSLESVLHGWKSITAHKLQREQSRQGKVWQEESFDRIMRDEEELHQKAYYLLTNPQRKWGTEIEYPWTYLNQEFPDWEDKRTKAEDAGTGARATGSTASATAGETLGAGAEARHADRGLFVVGDDAQSIYSFRGADYSNIRSFPKHFPGAAVFKLEVNYRSVPQVLRLANSILDEADPQFRKELIPVKPAAEEPPLLLACRDADEQANFVGGQLHQLREESGLLWRQMAVLYRAHSNRLEVELELTKRGIPFVVRGGLRFFEQAHIKDLLAYLIVLANGRDEIAWQRLLEMQQRVGTKTAADVIRKLRGAPDSQGGPLGKFTNNGVVDSIRGQAKSSLGELQRFLRELEPRALTSPPAGLIEQILERRFKEYLETKFENWRQRLEDLEQLVVYAQRHDSLPALLAEVGLSGTFAGQNVASADGLDDPEEGAVTLSTIHQAKGLEWTAVFVIHVQDEVIPHRLARLDAERAGQLSSAALGEDVWDTPLDEERRLLYVAVTRAEETLYLSYPQLSQTRDFQRIINRPSRFLAGLPGDAYDEAVLDWA